MFEHIASCGASQSNCRLLLFAWQIRIVAERERAPSWFIFSLVLIFRLIKKGRTLVSILFAVSKLVFTLQSVTVQVLCYLLLLVS